MMQQRVDCRRPRPGIPDHDVAPAVDECAAASGQGRQLFHASLCTGARLPVAVNPHGMRSFPLMGRTLIDEIPLVRREAEIDRIVAKLRGPTPAAFVLAGAAGVGKTRLASEAAKSAARLGFSTAQAVASRAAASIPFGPFAPFLPETGHSYPDLLGLLRQAS